MNHQERASLAGLRVVEFAHVIAAPLAGGLLADLGADVVHVEDPKHGDALRESGPLKDGIALWWKVSGRNKRVITLDLKSASGQAAAHDLVRWADVVITNFRPETLDRWQLDWETLSTLRPGLIYLQISGFGATSTQRNRPGFGKVAEARSGVAHLTGKPDDAPTFTGFSHGDAVTGLMGAMGVLAALHRRHSDPDFAGEWIDLSLPETLLRLIEWQVIVHDQLGTVPVRAGNQLAVAPGAIIDTYQSADDVWLIITSATPKSVTNIARLVGAPISWVDTAEGRRANAAELSDMLRAWVRERSASQCCEQMESAGVVGSPIYSVADIVVDENLQEIGALTTVADPDLGNVRMQNVVPRMTNHPGRIWRAGPGLGEDNEYVFTQLLGYSARRFDSLVRDGVV